ncbi:prepilin-type N-terminal cleavage/methylation domain-containing protein [Thermosulfurimonas sp. F29]|uniref:prepilin-type N-terminal cleavage/methylation domain-containing protein n=1 Tax=Thermosulfurimonas sp. F29 TaxID=2867247 RepID=UPI001C83D53D|nr:prepilin-type N-terminal cleavage/methylation domain-containing protein [Thermosulfurimonas sp. F29]MBX6424258.1 prepilin-type N-terminal cleavage/methylation domain-containing protein [Thermosulfurimonas sp. F29]
MNKKAKALTLFEVLVVLVLLGMLAAVVLPRLPVPWGERDFRVRVMRFLLRAEVRAVSSGRNLLVVVDPRRRALLLFPTDRFPDSRPLSGLNIPEEIEVRERGLLELPDGRPALIIWAEGFSSGGELEFVNRERQTSFVLYFPLSQMGPLPMPPTVPR